MPNVIPENARYTGPPSPERIRWILDNYHCDPNNALGGGHGALYRRVNGRLRKVQFDHQGHEVPPTSKRKQP